MENRIAQLRKERRISQAELADALEVTRQTVNSLENGKFNASLQLAHKIARYFGLSIEDVFLFAAEEEPKVTMTAGDFKKGYRRDPHAAEIDTLIYGQL